jgi:hypothetical protein
MEQEETHGEAQRGPTAQGEAQSPQGEAQRLQGTRGEGAQVIRLRPLRVLVVSADEPFRAASAMLIGRRDCVVFSLASVYGAAELIVRERIDVAVVDGAEGLRALAGELVHTVPPVGVVSVGEAEDVGAPGGPMLARWTRFEDLFDAIERADRARLRECLVDERWPAGARSHRPMGSTEHALD